MPAAQRLLREHGLQGRDVEATGPNERLLKEDVLRHVASQASDADAGLSSAAASTDKRSIEDAGTTTRIEGTQPSRPIFRRTKQLILTRPSTLTSTSRVRKRSCQ